jgi:triacylglycerol lipase
MTTPALRNPIVLVHGLLGYDEMRVAGQPLIEYFRGIPGPLRAAGNRVLVPCLSPTRGIAERAEQLKQFLDREAIDERVHLIAHSMGGLDSRHMITHLDMAARVLTLTTIGTPHRGSPFAELGVRRLEPFLTPWFRAFDIPAQAFLDLTTTACREFNERTPDSPRVRYFSIAGRCDRLWCRPAWWPSFGVVEQAEGPNDGVVSVASATYGESLTMWEGDHLNLINLPNPYERLSGRWRDRAADYGELVARLAREGFA